ncbi:MAG TPA: DUF2185 domain-containing protein [Planctomycetota bacterium]|nr:DUF2185 domain-containing protein [Planctomycetota bacterium]
MKRKTFKLSGDKVRDLAKGHGSGIASDKVTVEGLPVGSMTREKPANPQDSGWRFFSATEARSYLEDPGNFTVFDVNSIVNFDIDILPFLHSEVGSTFMRDRNGRFAPKGELPAPPVRRLTREWSLKLNSGFRQRIEDAALVLWAPNRTIWITAWDAKKGESPDQRLAWIKRDANPTPVERYEPAHPSQKRFGYLLMEDDDPRNIRWGLYAFSVSPGGGHLQMAYYFDHRIDLDWALKTWESVEFGAAT